jgi:asparagine synthase (glutamine-hydrolysing)
VLDRQTETVLEQHLEQIMEETPCNTLIDRLALADLQLWVREHFNQRVDRMSMCNSIEARVPFQDMEVVEFALGIPMAARMNGNQSKYLLRRAFADVLPEIVLKRPKRPFATPMSSWLRGPLRAFTQELFSESVIRKHQLLDPKAVQETITAFLNGDESEAFRVNALLNFQLWCEINL